MTEHDRGGWVETFTGRKFHLFDPKPEDVDFNDIAHALSQINRYTGHTRHPCSVGMHVLLVADMARKYAPKGKADRYELLGLMHDFDEAYTGDFPTPLKRAIKSQPGMREWWDDLIHGINTAIYGAADVAMPNEYEERIVKFFDLKAFVLESYYCLPLRGHTHDERVKDQLITESRKNPRFPAYNDPYEDIDAGILHRWNLKSQTEISTEILSRLARLRPMGE
jgi:hypothetical protein